MNWTVYNTSNSGLPSNSVYSIAVDENGTKWVGTGKGLAHFDGTNWVVYYTSNSGLPDNYVTTIAIDENGAKWIGTGKGLTHFDGTNWTVYNISNSDIPGNYISSIAIDGSGNKWIGSYSGLAVYNKGGVVLVEENKANIPPTDFTLYQNYPNPFNPSTTINFSVPKQSMVVLKVYDALGRELATLVNEEKPAGNYMVEFSAKSGANDLSSGIYFYQMRTNEFIQTKKMVLLR